MLHVLGATCSAEGVLGTKTYVTTPQGAHFVVLLFSLDGPLLACIEANLLGQIRTAATSGVATRFLASPDASVLGVIGSGFQARGQVEAICAVRPIRQVRVHSRSKDRVGGFCEHMRRVVSVEIVACDTARTAVEEADIVITATTARTPVLRGEWLSQGVHVNAVGSNAAERQEIDEETVRRAALVVVDDVGGAAQECGDLIAAERSGCFDWSRAHPLEDVVSGRWGRKAPSDVTLFESQGLASEDIAVAQQVYNAAVAARIGTPLPLSEL